MSGESERKTEEILSKPSLLYEYGLLVERLGVVGEKTSVLLLILALTSRLLGQVISVIVKGDSSGGKSYLLKRCLELFPEDAYYEYTSMSNKALIYTDKNFSHKFIIFYEFKGQENDEINHLIRTLQSEHRLKYEYTTKVDGEFKTISIDKAGPTGFITTTTKLRIFDENETRVFSLFVDESAEQTRRVCQRIGSEYEAGDNNVLEAEVERWKDLQQSLKPYKVRIPYATWLSQNVPHRNLRMRRDFERILLCISACALLHQNQRKTFQENGHNFLEASLTDYFLVKEALEPSLVKTYRTISPNQERLIKIINELYLERGSTRESQEVKEGVPINEVILRMGRPRSTVQRWLKSVIEMGQIEAFSLGKRMQYRPSRQSTALEIFLPSLERLASAYPELADNLELVHPISGEQVVLTGGHTGR